MVISEENKYIFIEVPKTASTSVRNFLLANDNTSLRNKAPDEQGNWHTVSTHVSARRLRMIMGDVYNSYRVFAFIRNPYSKVVSAYHYYRIGRPYKRMVSGEQRLSVILRVIFANAIPLNVWVFFYPFRDSTQFISDDSGKIIVHFLGIYESINEDINRIVDWLDLDINGELPAKNVSDYEKDFDRLIPLSKRFIRTRLKKDFSVYQKALDNRIFL